MKDIEYILINKLNPKTLESSPIYQLNYLNSTLCSRSLEVCRQRSLYEHSYPDDRSFPADEPRVFCDQEPGNVATFTNFNLTEQLSLSSYLTLITFLQARQKLAVFKSAEFSPLIVDLLSEAKRRQNVQIYSTNLTKGSN